MCLIAGSEVEYETVVPAGDGIPVFTLHAASRLPQVALRPLFLPQHPAGAEEVSPARLEYRLQLQ